MKFFAIVLLASACGGKDEPTTAPEPSPAKPEAPPARQVDVPAPRIEPPPPKRDYGTCNLEITGPATISETSAGGVSAVQVSYWADPSVRKMLWSSDQEGFILNCDGPQASLSFTATGTKDTLPFAARKYKLVRGAVDGVHALGRIKHADGTSLAGTEGTFEITAIDHTHVAGTFELTAQTLSKSGSGEAKVKGSFDYKCPSVCQH